MKKFALGVALGALATWGLCLVTVGEAIHKTVEDLRVAAYLKGQTDSYRARE